MPDNPKTSTRIETLRPNYWRDTALDQMSAAEWEALCDGCGKCCQLKLEDADTGKVSYTNIACRLFDDETCRCTNYPLRKSLVGGCLVLTPESLDYAKDWMPKTWPEFRFNAPRFQSMRSMKTIGSIISLRNSTE